MSGLRFGSSRPAERGQALVEFAVILPLFAFVAFGVVEMGRFVYTHSVLAQAAREGARVAAAEAGWISVSGAGCVEHENLIGPVNPGAHVCPVDVPSFRSHVISAADRMTVGISPVAAVFLSCNTGRDGDLPPTGAWTDTTPGQGNGCANAEGAAIASSGDLVSVRITYSYEPFVPLVGDLVGTVTLSGAATTTIH